CVRRHPAGDAVANNSAPWLRCPSSGYVPEVARPLIRRPRRLERISPGGAPRRNMNSAWLACYIPGRDRSAAPPHVPDESPDSRPAPAESSASTIRLLSAERRRKRFRKQRAPRGFDDGFCLRSIRECCLLKSRERLSPESETRARFRK